MGWHPLTDPDAIHDNVAGEIAAVAAKATPTTSDLLLIEDAADSNNKKRITLGGLPTTLGALTDVDVTGYTDGQGVFYRASTSQWENATAPEPLTDESATPAILFLEDDTVAMSEPFFD